MGIEIPDSLQWVAKYILGAGDWPEGDETAMRRLADAWTSMADTLNTVDDEAASALNAALTALSEGDTHDAIAAYRDKLLAGDEAAFTAIANYCRKQAELLDDGANDIEQTKLVIIGTMIVAAAELVAAGLTAWTGIGAAAGVAARVAAQVAVRIAMKQLLTRMIARGIAKAMARAALRGAAFEALEEGGIDAAARAIQVAKGDRSMDKFGWSDLALATFGGMVGGAVGGGIGGSKLGGLGDDVSSGLGKLAAKSAVGAGTELAADLSAQVAAAGAGAAFLDQEFKLDVGLDTFTSAGAGGIQSGLESSLHSSGEAPSVPDLGDTNLPGTGSPTSPAGTGSPSGTGTPAGAGSPDTGAPTSPAGTGSPGGTGTPAGAGSPDTGAPTSPAGTGTPGGTGTPEGTGTPGTGDPSATAPASTGAPDAGTGAPNSPGDTGTPGGNPSGTGSPAGDGTPANGVAGDAGGNPSGTASPAGDGTPANGSPAGTGTPSAPDNGAGSTNPAGTGTPSAPGDTALGTPQSPGTPGDTSPSTPSTPGDTSPASPATPGDTTPSTPPTPGDTSPSSPSTPGDTAPSTPSTPGDTSPNSSSTPGETTPGTPSTPGDTTANSPSPSTPSAPGDTPSTPGATSPGTPSTPGDTTPNSPPPSAPSTTGDTPSTPGGTNPAAPSAPHPGTPTTPGDTSPTGTPTTTTPSTPQAAGANPNSAPNPTGAQTTPTPSSLDLPPADATTPTQPGISTEPSTAQPNSTTTPSQPATTTPSQPGITTPSPSTATPSQPGLATPGNPGTTPATDTPASTPSTTTPTTTTPTPAATHQSPTTPSQPGITTPTQPGLTPTTGHLPSTSNPSTTTQPDPAANLQHQATDTTTAAATTPGSTLSPGQTTATPSTTPPVQSTPTNNPVGPVGTPLTTPPNQAAPSSPQRSTPPRTITPSDRSAGTTPPTDASPTNTDSPGPPPTEANDRATTLPSTGATSRTDTRPVADSATTPAPNATPPAVESESPAARSANSAQPSTEFDSPAVENAARARQSREALRATTPADNRALRVTPFPGKPYLSASYPHAPGGPAQVVRITTAVTGTDPAAVDTLSDRLQLATDLSFNQGHRFPIGSEVVIDTVPSTDPTTADLVIDADTDPSLDDLANSIRDHLGLPTRDTDPALTPADIESIGGHIDQAALRQQHQPSWADQHPAVDTEPAHSTPASPDSAPPARPSTPGNVEATAPTTNSPTTPGTSPTPPPGSHPLPQHQGPLPSQNHNVPVVNAALANQNWQDRMRFRNRAPQAQNQFRNPDTGRWVDWENHDNKVDQPVSVVRLRVFIGGNLPPHVRAQIESELARIADTSLNANPNARLISGDPLLIDILPVTDPAQSHLIIDPNQITNSHQLESAIRHHLGISPQHGVGITDADARELSNNIAHANTPANISDPGDQRVYGPNRLSNVEHPSYQHYVEDLLRVGNSFAIGADPRTNPYGSAVNDGGPTVNGRGNNCLDCSLSALSSFFGVPAVSAPRTLDQLPDGTIDRRSGEIGGTQRAEAWLGEGLRDIPGLSVSDQFAALHAQIAAMGPGSAALVVNTWHARDSAGNPLYNQDGTPFSNSSHATVIVYPLGASGPVWWDPQQGTTSDTPPPSMLSRTAALFFTPINPPGGTSHATTGPHAGTGTSPAGDSVRSEPGIPGDRDPARLGGTTPVDNGRAAAGDGARPGELRDQQGNRGDHLTQQQLADGSDRAGVRPGDREPDAGSGVSGLPTTTPNRPEESGRGSEHSPLPPADHGPDASGHTPDPGTADDHQAPVRISPDLDDARHRDLLGLEGERNDGSVAERGHDPGVGRTEPHPPAESNRTPDTADTDTPAPETTPDPAVTATNDLDAIHDLHAEQTPAGVSHHRGDPTMGDLPHRVPADPNRFTADTHITPDGFARIGDHTLTPEEYGDLLRRSGWDGVSPIRLIGCDASRNGFADRLARHLGVEVLAPTQRAWTDANGSLFSTSAVTNPDGTRSPRVPPDGQWQTHGPSGAVRTEGHAAHPPNIDPVRDIDRDSAVDRARHVPPRTDTPDRDPTPQRSAEWNPPTNDDGSPLPRVPMQVPPGTRVADLSGTDQLEPNSRMVVTDLDGNPVGTFYTDAHRNITHAEVEFPNTGHDRTVSAVGIDPNIARPEPGVTYLLRDPSGSYVHSYSGQDTPSPRASGPEPDGRHNPDSSDPRDRREPSPAQQFDRFRTGPIAPAVDWNPTGDREGNYQTGDPVAGYDPTVRPFSLTGPRDPFTRYDVYDTNGDWHGSFYTDRDGNFSHVHTWSGNQSRGFNPELGTGSTWDAGLPVPIPNATFAVGPRYLGQHGFDPRVPQQLFRTDEHGDTEAASFIPTYAPRGTSSTHFVGRRGTTGSNVQQDVGQIASGGSTRRSPVTYLPGEYDRSGGPYHRFNGGHLAPYESGGPGERINHVPQWEYQNMRRDGPGHTREDTWRATEEALADIDRSPDATVERVDVFAERTTPDRVTPDRLHTRYLIRRHSDSTTLIEARSYPNVP